FVHFRFQRLLARLYEMKPALRHIISEKELMVKLEGAEHTTLTQILSQLPAEEPAEADRKAGLVSWDDVPKAPKELAAIFYTSGSTGQGKGVMLSHRSLVANTVGTVEYLKLTESDSVIVILPFYYIYGNSLLLTHVAVGGCLVIDNRFMYAETVLDTMQAERVTGLSGVPSNFLILLNNSTFPTREFPSLRYFTQAGGGMAPDVIRRLYETFPDKEVYIMYGQTEASPRVTWLPPDRLREKLGSVGIEVPGVKVRIIKENGEEASVGEEGEIVVGGDSVMMGYWNQPDEQQEVLKDSWLYTGDLAKRDEDGFIFIVGRRKEIIKSGGNRISVKEVEECLLTNEKIHEVAVFGVPDDIFGEAVKAVVVLKQGFESNFKEIQRHCRQSLAEHKIPRHVEFVEELPKYQSGKVNKLALKSRPV
ncbi:MAG TPA: AMP-binding protein, partial [candidate division Zixibacteria bacterium]|nr:AMP-binding protein [candidate division Zixibacteria bacterium]